MDPDEIDVGTRVAWNNRTGTVREKKFDRVVVRMDDGATFVFEYDRLTPAPTTYDWNVPDISGSCD